MMILKLIPGATPIDIALEGTETTLQIEYTKDKTLRIEGTVVDEHHGKTQFFSSYPKIVTQEETP